MQLRLLGSAVSFLQRKKSFQMQEYSSDARLTKTHVYVCLLVWLRKKRKNKRSALIVTLVTQ